MILGSERSEQQTSVSVREEHMHTESEAGAKSRQSRMKSALLRCYYVVYSV